MDDKEILVLLESLEDEGYDDSVSDFPEDTQTGVCPCCKADSFYDTTIEHKNNCRLNKAIKELRSRTE